MSRKILLAIFGAVAAAASVPTNGRDIDERRPSNDLCVNGAPSKNGGYTIHYQEVQLPSANQANGYILDRDWVAQHGVGDSSHYFAGSAMFPWAENKCQYTCNAIRECVSFVGYQTPNSTPDNGEIYCHFFDALIESNMLSARAPNDPSKITHAYNELCDQK